MIELKKIYNKLFDHLIIFLILVSIIIAIFLFLFLYNNFYQTITYSDEILILRSEVAMEDIDINKFDKVINNMQEKIKLRDSDAFIKF